MEKLFFDIHQIGIVVKDLKKTIKEITYNYGIGPWNAWIFDKNLVVDMSVRGKDIDYAMLVATCKSGNIDWEIIEPLDDISIYAEYLKKYGEGIQHVNYIVKDFNKVSNYLKDRNTNIIQYGNLVGKHIYAYFDTENDAKHVIETSANLPGFKRKEPLFTFPDSEKNKTIKPIFNKIVEIGIVVKNIKKTASIMYKKYKLGPWKFSKLDKNDISNMHINGEIVDYSFKTAICQVGGARLKLVEPNDNKTLYSKYLNKFGEGLCYIGFNVNDLNETSKKLPKKQRKILQSGKLKGKKFAFFNTQDNFKFNACFYEVGD